VIKVIIVMLITSLVYVGVWCALLYHCEGFQWKFAAAAVGSLLSTNNMPSPSVLNEISTITLDKMTIDHKLDIYERSLFPLWIMLEPVAGISGMALAFFA
jgi:hypothetical protein